MKRFVLVHGAWHGAWCWHKLIPLLRIGDASVIADDLPGLGVDRTPPYAVTMQSYVDRVCEAVDASDGPVHLLGHSMGGAVVTQVAEALPHKVQCLIYLTALLLPAGRSLFEALQGATGSGMLAGVEFSADQSTVRVRPEAAPQLFYADCSEADHALAQSLLVAQAVAPFVIPIRSSDARWGRVPRVYIECTQDQALGLAMQRSMQAESPCQSVYTLDTSHSPFLSAPETLASLLLSL